MPEAVVSNNISLAAVHIVRTTSFSKIADDLENIHGSFAVLTAFAADEIDKSNRGSSEAWGYLHLKSKMLDELEEVRRCIHDIARLQIEAKLVEGRLSHDAAQRAMWPDLYAEVVTKWADILCESDTSLDPDHVTDWRDEMRSKFFEDGTRYYNELIAKLNGSVNPIFAGSLLPWLEVRMRHEFAKDDRASAAVEDRPTLIRDQFITKSHLDGFDQADIAQALGLTSEDVKRVIDRLTGADVERRKAG